MGKRNKENVHNQQFETQLVISASKTPFADQTNRTARIRHCHHLKGAEKVADTSTTENHSSIFQRYIENITVSDNLKSHCNHLQNESLNPKEVSRSNVLPQRELEKVEDPNMFIKQLRIKCIQIDINKLQKPPEIIPKQTPLNNILTDEVISLKNEEQNIGEIRACKRINFEKKLVINLQNFNIVQKKEFEMSTNKKQVSKKNMKADSNILSNATNSANTEANTDLNVRNLRKKITMNYAEQSLDTSENISVCAINAPAIKPTIKQKLPIYKNAIQDKGSQKEPRQSNLYDFNDFDDAKQSKKPKTRRKISMFDKTTHDILQKIQHKEDKQHRKQIRRRKNTDIPVANMQIGPDSPPNYQKTVSNIMQSVMNKIQQKQPEENLVNSKTHHHECVPHQIKNQLQFQNAQIQISQNDNDYFGFDVEEDKDSPKSANAVNIISNIVVQRGNIDSPSLFLHQRPNANSTICNQVHNNSSPWRYRSKELRNPHFLEVKRSALPSLTQDPIIDHTLDLDVSMRSSRYRTASPKKSHIQTSIVDYIDTDDFKENQDNLKTQSLFDCEEFDSPVKRNDTTLTTRSRPKRKVLAPQQNNSPEIVLNSDSTLITDIDKSFENKQVTFFGFDDSDDEVNVKSLNSRPFRINANPKKYSRKRNKTNDTNPEEPQVVQETISPEFITEDERNRNSDNMQLFDDPEAIFNERLVSPKIVQKRRRQRRLSWQLDDRSVDEKSRKKRKDVRTKSEEERFEQWAAAFNAMCEEVDKHELEIE